jgi:hypothetical protein
MKGGGTSINTLICSINPNDSLKCYPSLTALDIGANLTCIDLDLVIELNCQSLAQNRNIH